MSRSRGLAIGLLSLLVVATAWVSLEVVGTDYWCDDAFISFRYADNLTAGHGLVYNAGERVEGYTNALWTLAAAAWIELGLEPIFAAQWTSLAAQAATLVLVFAIGRGAGHGPLRALLAPALLATQVDFLAYPMTGMETSFFTLLVTLALALVLRGSGERPVRSLGLGLVLLAIVLTRFDGFVMAGILLTAMVSFADGALGRRLRRLGPALLVLVPAWVGYNLWRLVYYGSPLPNSFHAKTHLGAEGVLTGLAYVGRFVTADRVALLLLALAALLLVGPSRRSRILATVVVLHTAYVVVVGGDWMPHHRFLLPILPAFVLLAQEGVWGLWGRLRDGLRRPRLVAGTLAALLIGFSITPVLEARPFGEFSVRAFDPQHAREIGSSLAAELPDDALIAVEWGGIISYYSRLPTLELFGLTDYEMARADLPRTVWGLRPTPEYVASRGPRLIVACGRLFDSVAEARSCGRHVGRGWFRAYTSPKMEPFGYRFEIRRAGDRFWPAWVRTE